MIDHVEAVILAGGASTRMGTDKVHVEWQGVPLLKRVHASLSAVFTRVRVVTRPGTTAPFGLPVIEDTYAVQAPMVGIHAALAACERSAVLVAACDLPEIDPRFVLGLVAMVPTEHPCDVVAPKRDGRFEPLLAIYRPRLLPELSRRIAASKLGLQALLSDVDTFAIDEVELRRLDPELRSLRNVNRPADLDPHA